MSIIGWIVLGLIAGFIASKIVEGSGQGFFLNMALGIVGAVVGGFLYSLVLGGEGVTGVNIGSIIVSIIGAIIVLWVYNAVAVRRPLSRGSNLIFRGPRGGSVPPPPGRCSPRSVAPHLCTRSASLADRR